MATPDFIRQTLDDLRARDLYRRLVAVGSAAGPRISVGGREVLQFASNNYLGLAGDPRVREAAVRAIERWGWGAGASRLLAGHTDAHAAIEADLAAFKGTEAALVFPSGYMANLGAVTALVGRGDIVACDRENHASIYDAVRLSGAELARYPHGDVAAAVELLNSQSAIHNPQLLLVTDTVFSMGGDVAPLAELAAACRVRGAMLLVDEAHALGVLGPTGAGLAEEMGAVPFSRCCEKGTVPISAKTGTAPVSERPETGAAPFFGDAITASVGTLSKALGGVGGFVVASRDVIELLVNCARPFIYSTALPAAACEAARAALAIVRSEPERRTRLLALADRLRRALCERGFDCGRSETPIIPVIVGDPARALAMAGSLFERGIFCPAIRPPTVPPGTSRLRISLTAEHTEEDIDLLVEALVASRDKK
jgi:8-amino-7-oxononanoate synthase